jgi:hypothetical protein
MSGETRTASTVPRPASAVWVAGMPAALGAGKIPLDKD